MRSKYRHKSWLGLHLQAESTGPLGTLQDEQTRLKAEYDRMEVLCPPLHIPGLSGCTTYSPSWPAFHLVAACIRSCFQACMLVPDHLWSHQV